MLRLCLPTFPRGLESTSWEIFPGSPSVNSVRPCSGKVCISRCCGGLGGVVTGSRWPQMTEAGCGQQLLRPTEAARRPDRAAMGPCGSRDLREICPTRPGRSPQRLPWGRALAICQVPKLLIRACSALYLIPHLTHPAALAGDRKSHWWVRRRTAEAPATIVPLRPWGQRGDCCLDFIITSRLSAL